MNAAAAARRRTKAWSLPLLLGALGGVMAGMLTAPSPASAEDRPIVFAWISLEPAPERPDLLAITAQATTLTPFEGRYELIATRKSGGGSSNTKQSGVVNAAEAGSDHLVAHGDQCFAKR